MAETKWDRRTVTISEQFSKDDISEIRVVFGAHRNDNSYVRQLNVAVKTIAEAVKLIEAYFALPPKSIVNLELFGKNEK